ncbi:MAG: tRNA (adenosine(37)-N6)-threonylcarbamoyltransferase complex ATPase subunit type 1 TsaE [Clostridia bacterium]|nr:tRNA (adenosine(37)-N6)-threonylcarbamoyltransferase complex ATPase subunit type 1 TsaE [Clostridia bacterium]
MKFVTNSAEETRQLGIKIGEKLKSGDVVAMFGSMGMGKTAFTHGLAEGLGIDQKQVSSPTFALVHEYNGKHTLYHFDMYRIESWDDLYSTGFFDYLDYGGILAVEWSENIENALPEDSIRIHFEKGESEFQRIITIDGGADFENTCN